MTSINSNNNTNKAGCLRRWKVEENQKQQLEYRKYQWGYPRFHSTDSPILIIITTTTITLSINNSNSSHMIRLLLMMMRRPKTQIIQTNMNNSSNRMSMRGS